MFCDYKSDAYGKLAALKFIPSTVRCRAEAVWIFFCYSLWFVNKQSMFFPVLLLLFYFQYLLGSYIIYLTYLNNVIVR